MNSMLDGGLLFLTLFLARLPNNICHLPGSEMAFLADNLWFARNQRQDACKSQTAVTVIIQEYDEVEVSALLACSPANLSCLTYLVDVASSRTFLGAPLAPIFFASHWPTSGVS